MNHLSYKGYFGSIEYNSADGLLFGKVLGVRSLIKYEGRTGKELELGFRQALEDYISTCKEIGIVPEKPFKGSFNVRIPAKLHREAALLAMKNKKSLNSFVAESIREKVLRESQ